MNEFWVNLPVALLIGIPVGILGGYVQFRISEYRKSRKGGRG
jgi:hypothetical protein